MAQERKPSIAVAIPCHNEEPTIGKVVEDFQRALPGARVIVFDNCSTDSSAEIARAKGAEVVAVRRLGKGRVVRSIFAKVDADIYILVDGDDTYPAEEVGKLLAPLLAEEADMAVGTRLEYAANGSFRPLHQFGNSIIARMVNFSFRAHLSDVLSGYRAITRELVQEVAVLSSGFEVETELTLEALRRGFRIREVPLPYRSRPAGSRSKLHTFRDGYRILTTILVILRDHRPLMVFSSLALFLWMVGLASGSVVVAQYAEIGLVYRLPLGVFAVGCILLGSLLFVTGFIIDTLNRRVAELKLFMERQLRK